MTDSRDHPVLFECKKHHMRQTESGWVISFVVHPDDDVPHWFSKAKLGTPMSVTAELIDYDNPEPPARKKREPEGRFNELPPSEQAGILCKDTKFWQWLNETQGYHGIDNKDTAAAIVRSYCAVRSRSELDWTDEAPYLNWRDWLAEFREWQHTDARYKDNLEKQRAIRPGSE